MEADAQVFGDTATTPHGSDGFSRKFGADFGDASRNGRCIGSRAEPSPLFPAMELDGRAGHHPLDVVDQTAIRKLSKELGRMGSNLAAIQAANPAISGRKTMAFRRDGFAPEA